MPAATRWRAIGIEANGALHLGRLQLLASGAPVTVDTITSTFAPDAGSLAALDDGDAETACTFQNAVHRAPGFVIEWSLTNAEDVTDAASDGTMLAATIQYLDGGIWRTAFRYVPGKVSDTLFPYTACMWRLDGSLQGEGQLPTDLYPMYGGEIWGSALGSPYAKSARFSGALGAGVGALRTWGSNIAAFGAGDFEIWMRVRIDAGATANYGRLIESKPVGSGAGGWNLARDAFTNPPRLLFHPSTGGGYVFSGTFSNLEWHYVGVRCKAGILGIFVDGNLQASVAHPFDYTAGDVAIGGNMNGAERMAGYINDVLIIKGFSRPLTSFTLPTNTAPSWEQPDARTVRRNRDLLAYSTPLSQCSSPLHRAREARDMEFGGRASIVGDVGIKGAGGAPDTMVKSRVRLLRQRDGLLARETWSNPATGAFAFDGLDESQQFIALAEDSSGVYAPVAADRRVPGVPA